MRFQFPPRLLLLAAASVAFILPASAQGPASFQAVDLDTPLPPGQLAARLAGRRVVFIGETHDRYDHHLNQLAIIQALHSMHPDLSIGVEYLEQRFQPQVDDYIAGTITEQEFLRSTEYFREWGYDYRLYAPIFRFAREEKIPVRALNVPTAIASAVARVGLAGLAAQQRAVLPTDIAPADADYRNRLRDAFDAHASKKPGAFDHFVEAQLVWDESMAASAAEYLNANPDRPMVILAGAGHLEFGSGIPQRLERRTHATYAIVINGGEDEDVAPHLADYILLSLRKDLPPTGILGATFEEKRGECRVRALSPDGAAEKSGLKRGDVVLDIDGQPVKAVPDVHLALWDRKPGDRVKVRVRRSSLFGGAAVRDFDLELQAAKDSPPG